MLKKYLSFYKKGFLLVSKNPLIYGTVLFFSIGPQIDKITKSIGFSLGPVINIASFIIGLLALGSLFVSIKTLDDASEKKEITQELVLENYKKTCFKSVKLMLLAISITIIMVLILYYFKHKNPLLLIAFSSYIWLIFIPFSPIIIFFNIYYAVKNKSFINSLTAAINFYIKNIPFISISICFGLVNWVITSLLAVNGFNKLLNYYLYNMIISYLTLIISAASLLYFKDKEQINP